MDSKMIISVGIVAYNEEEYINTLLSELHSQDYPHELTELLLINSMSNDSTVEIFKNFRKKYSDEYKAIKVLDNPGKIQAAGWNVAINNFCGDALIRVDAHAKITDNFISANVNCLESGEMVCGGMRPNIVAEDTPKSRLVLLADSSMFGSSFGKYHSSTGKRYTDTVFHGCYRREVIEKVGLFNEKLGRTEDNDYHSRVRSAGFKICYDPEIKSFQFSRSSVFSSLKQKYGNGYWVGRTIAVNPKCISLFHFVPFLFLIAIIAALVLGFTISVIPLVLLALLYGAADIFLSISAIFSCKSFHPLFLLLPFLFFALHISYGIGTLFGLISIAINPPCIKKDLDK